MNLAAFLLYFLNEKKIRAGKDGLPGSVKWMLALLGGGAGILLARRIYLRWEQPGLLAAALLALLAWGILLGSLFFIHPGNPGAEQADSGRTEIAEETDTAESREDSSEDTETEGEPSGEAGQETAESENSEASEDTEETGDSNSGQEDSESNPEESETPDEETSEEPTSESESAENADTSDTETEDPEETEAESSEESTDETEEEPEPVLITIAAIGDMLMHPGVSGLAFQPDGSINYDFIFEPIREDIINADIAAVNNEVPFAGNELGLQNYPNFNVFSELGDAEVRAGFDVITNATNHVMDQGAAGVYRTLDFWKRYPETKVLGIHETPEDRDQLRIIEVKGVRIALLNYTYGSNGGFPYDQPFLIDKMETPEDRERIRSDLQRAEQEADFTIVFPHWGEEYQLRETPGQDDWARFFTENGADLIIGTHPHVLEPVRMVYAENGNQALCYFSIGNYISLQDETMSVLGGLAKVTLAADKDGIRIDSYDINYLVTHYEGDINNPRVIRLEQYPEELAHRHGILTNNLPGNGLNVAYPFGIDTFYRIIAEVRSYE